MTQNRCESASCCTHPPESEAVLKRDGVLHLVCLECHAELGPAPEITQRACVIPEMVSSPAVAALAPQGAPCGEDVANQWGGPL